MRGRLMAGLDITLLAGINSNIDIKKASVNAFRL